MYSFSVATAVHGFHVYKNVWEPTVAEVLLYEREIGNSHDMFAVAIGNSSEIVGHVPRFLSSICSIFIQRGGKISCKITGTRCYFADLHQGGMEIPCTLVFKSSIKECRKTECLIKSAGSEAVCVSAITNIAEVLAEIKSKASEEPCNCTNKVESSSPFSPNEVSLSTSLKAKDVIEMLSDEEVTVPPTKN